jgi:hypothetical protein
MDDRQRYEASMTKRRKTVGNAWVDKANASKTAFNSEFQDFITRYARINSAVGIGLLFALTEIDRHQVHRHSLFPP